MDNIQLILYIVFLVGYFIYKMLAGKNKPITREDTGKYDQVPKGDSREDSPRQDPQYEQQYDSEYEQEYDPRGDGPKSFEEILEELAGGGREKARKKEQAQQKARELEEVARSKQQEASEVYSQSVKNASKYSTLDERIDIDNIDINIKEVEDLDGSTVATGNPYLSMFRTLDDAKKAIVMNEILNRKY